MIRRYGTALRSLLMVADGVAATALGIILYQGVAHPDTAVASFLDVFWLRGLVYGLAWVGLLYINGAYRLRAHWTVSGEARSVVRAGFWLALVGVTALLLSASDQASSGWVLLLFPLQVIVAIALRVMLRSVFTHFRGRGYNVRNILIIGTGPNAIAFSELLERHRDLGVRVAGYLGEHAPDNAPKELYWGPVERLPLVLQSEVIDEVAVCQWNGDWEGVQEMMELAQQQGKPVRVPLPIPPMGTSDRSLEDVDGTAVMSFVNGPDELLSYAAKRVFDLAITIAGLLLLWPLMLAIAMFLRVREGPGVLFRQERVGLHGRPFTIMKFRTMTHDAEDRYPELAERSHTRGAAFKLPDDPRVTSTGRWLRRYHLDELPQLLNVLRGEMSIVGPRPAPPREVDEYDGWHRRRLSVRPGITGLWQVTRALDDDFTQRAELDIAYVERRSLRLDLAIVARTIPAVLRRPGH